MTTTEAPRTPRPEPAVEHLGDGVWQIPVVIPNNPLGYTLVHLLPTPRGPVLVDTGWDHDDSWSALRDGVAATGHDIADCYGVLLTHAHADHHGLSGRVREASGAWVAMHVADAELVTRHRRDHRSWLATMGAAFLAAGAPEESFADLPAPGTPSPIPVPVLPDRIVADGEFVDVPGARVRAVWTPGHTPGHVCYLLESSQRLLTGDHLLPRISPHIGLWNPEDDRDRLGDFLDSLRRVRELGAREALPAHQWRFTDPAARAEELIVHHEQRCSEILAVLADGPREAWAVSAQLRWKGGWEAIPILMKRVALAETLAHLRHLERRGLVAEEPGPRPRRYAALSDRLAASPAASPE